MNVFCHIKKDILRDYLHHLFAYENDAFSIFRDTKVGKFICSMVKYSDFPVEQKFDPDKSVSFKLPKTSAMPGLFQRFCYISIDDQQKIEDYITATFENDWIQFYYNGMALKLKQKDVIQTYILSRKLVSKIGDPEQLKKRQYRSEEKQIKQLYERLAKRVRIQNAAIKKVINEYQDAL
ncbi:hypothetical protein QE382_002154 [Sphingobacterium zeae]|uniref:Uncharacterized protein n=1 Tax=Sphingobacterium zeae TaxID=1776859 RepID=A0ABU0U5D5_9SPHI|nr:hypothetical protein [Sphingobacterium zeae]MDQ1150170.1 hypothetical protein [Sphingobacterium zeae]